MSLNDERNYLRDGPFESNIRIVKLHPTKGSHWIAYKNEKYFASNGCARPQHLSKFVTKRNGHCLYSEYKNQGQTSKRDSYFASYCLYTLYLAKVLGIDFISAVLNLYHQMIQSR